MCRVFAEAGDAQACAFLELTSAGHSAERFGVGMDTNIVTASVKALVSGVNRLGLVLQALDPGHHTPAHALAGVGQ